jgi:hypothetical protein
MCPLCITAIAAMAAGGGTLGGVACLVLTRFDSAKHNSTRGGNFSRRNESSQETGDAVKIKGDDYE